MTPIFLPSCTPHLVAVQVASVTAIASALGWSPSDVLAGLRSFHVCLHCGFTSFPLTHPACMHVAMLL